jgi:hypothetical protein
MPRNVEKPMTNFIELTRICLEAHENHNAFNKEGNMVAPNDPRYTDLIGPWNGYQSPEQRWNDWHVERKRLRRTILDWLHDSEYMHDIIVLDDNASEYLDNLRKGFVK